MISQAWYHFFVAITDTTSEARSEQLRIYRSMPDEQRLLLAFEMSIFARELCRARIHSEHPDWPEKQIAHELLRLAFIPDPLPPELQ